MKDRIRLIIENENLTPAKFADKLQVNRSIISHILNGRNNVSLDVVMKILSEMTYLNSEWLLNGIGPMYKDGINADSIPQEPDLFHQNEVKQERLAEKMEEGAEFMLKPQKKESEFVENKQINSIKISDKKITQIMIYYSDHTFESFIPNPSKSF